MAEAGREKTRRDSKRRVLCPGESIRADGKYQYKYHIDGKPHFVYSWKLEPTDKLPPGKKPCLSLRELEKQVNSDLDRLLNVVDGTMTVCELVDRYLKTKTGVRQNTRTGYVTVQRILAKEPFGQKKIRTVKTSDAKLFLIKLQQEDGKSYSSIHTIRGVLRPAFQMAVDDDILVKNPFGFQLAGVVVNDSVTREAISREQMFQAIIEDREPPKMEKVIDGCTGFLFYDDDGNPLVAMHWQHRFNRMVGRYNDIYRVQMPNITPHVCRHTYCSNMAKSGMNPKTLQYLMGHSDISVTMNVYTHISFDDAEEELKRMEEFRKAQAEIEKKNDAKAVSQKMFKVV